MVALSSGFTVTRENWDSRAEQSKKVRHRERDKMERTGGKMGRIKENSSLRGTRGAGDPSGAHPFLWGLLLEEPGEEALRHSVQAVAECRHINTCFVPNLFPTTPRPGNLPR